MRFLPASAREATNPLSYWKAEAQQLSNDRLLLVTDFERRELVQAYMAADLFVFASNIEYSPLVLYETVAAGTPFLSVPVGHTEEIARWTGGGMICPAEKDERGYTRVAPAVLAREIAKAIEDPKKLSSLGKAGQDAWKERFTWSAIAREYEAILSGFGSSGAGR
jgi:glycosyltransferase involved in cell wall biosynthesis